PRTRVHPAREAGARVEKRAQSIDVAPTDRLERREHLGRSLALTLVLGPDALDRRDERAPGLEAVLPCDRDMRVFEPARHIRRRAPECLLVTRGDTGRELFRALLVEGHRLQADSSHRPLRSRRVGSPLQLGPRPIAVLDGHDVLRVAEPETTARPRT